MIERNKALVLAAKAAAYARDHRLPCEVCGFSFLARYGEHGADFIEAHHRVPVSELTEETENRVEDLAMVCANCHRMLHRGERSLSIPELKALLNR